MNKFLIFLIYVLNLNPAFSMDCNEKKLEAIINSFVTKIEANIPITQQHVLQVLQQCSNLPPQSLSQHEQESISSKTSILHQSETPPNLKDVLAIFNNIQTSYPEARSLLMKISEGISRKIKENDQKQKELMEWKSSNVSQIPHSSKVEGGKVSKYSKNKDILDYFANADHHLSKTK